VLVTADDAAVRARLEARARDRAADDHSDADVRIYDRMRSREFEPPAGGHLEIRNGPGVAEDVARVVAVVRGT
jgi:predicted kinase